MDKDLRGLVAEIILLAVMLVIIVPVCANASSRYREQRDALLSGAGTSVDISHNGDMKKVTVYSEHDDIVRVNLFFKINKVMNDYNIYFDGEVYNLRDLEYTEDSDNRYYRLGIYEIDDYREFDFKISANGSKYYNETIIYSFVTEGLL